MKTYALTITNNCRLMSHELDELKAPIQEVLDRLHDLGVETGHLGWEFQERSPYCLHVHTYFIYHKMPFFKKLNQNKNLNIKCDTLDEPPDVVTWVAYCHKQYRIPLQVRFDQSRVELYNAKWFKSLPLPSKEFPEDNH